MTSAAHLLAGVAGLAPDIDISTCSPEMLNGTSAEISTRIKATNMNQTVDPSYIWVTCGTVMGKMHKNKFFCPGIHMKCIELDDGDMVTPKNLVILAEKEKLKDWKTAVRVNGMPIRRFMERGLLDFHDHVSTCTMKCLSRAGATPLVRDSASPINVQFQVPAAEGITENMLNSMQILQENGPLSPYNDSLEERSPTSPVPVSMVATASGASSASLKHVLLPMATSTPQGTGRKSGNKRKSLFVHQTPIQNSKLVMLDCDKPKVQRKRIGADFDAVELGLLQENEADCQVFWKGILRVGMLDHIVQDIVNEIHNLKRNLVMSGVGRAEARQFSKVVKQLGMSEKIQNKVMTQKSEMQKQKDALKKEMDDLKRRVAAAEQKQYDLKRKAASLDQLMDFTMKRPALMTNYSLGVDSDDSEAGESAARHEPSMAAFPEPELTVTSAYVHVVKQEVEEEEEDEAEEYRDGEGTVSPDAGSFTSHVDNDAVSGSLSPSQSHTDLIMASAKRRSATMLENVLKKLKEK